MFKGWQIAVASVAAVYLVTAIHDATPYFVALPTALLMMSILAGDPGTAFAASLTGAFAKSFSGDRMKVKLTRGYKGMPDGANVGDEIDIDDADFAEQRRLGNVERSQAQGEQRTGAQPQNKPTANDGTSQQRSQQDQSPTAVQPVDTDRFRQDS